MSPMDPPIDGIIERERILSIFKKIFSETKISNFDGQVTSINNIIQKNGFDIEIKIYATINEFLTQENISNHSEVLEKLSNFPQIHIMEGEIHFFIEKLGKQFLVAKSANIFHIIEILSPILFSYIDKLYRLEEQQWIFKTQKQILNLLSSALESRDNYTHGHSERVARYSKAIAEQYYDNFYESNKHNFTESWRLLEKDEFCNRIEIAGLLHDVGKIGMDDALKKAGSLTDAEFNFMKTHVRESSKIVSQIDRMQEQEIHNIIREHHERCDGRGYLGRKKNEIHIGALIIAIADSFDAMTSDRVYRRKLPWHYALDDLRINSFYNVIYDTNVFWAFELSIVKRPEIYEISRKNNVYKNLCKFHKNLGGNYKKEEHYKEAYQNEKTLHCFTLKSGHEELICNAYYIKNVLNSRPDKSGVISFALIREIKDVHLIRTIKQLLKEQSAEIKLIGYFDGMHIIIISEEDKDLYNLLSIANSKKNIKEKITAKIIELNNYKDLKIYEEIFNEAKEKLKTLENGKILYYGDAYRP